LQSRRLSFKPEIDVRGMRGYEALAEIQQFLDEAVMTESMELTILHGKGNGILRQLIRDYLASLNFVKPGKMPMPTGAEQGLLWWFWMFNYSVLYK
jgi:DNA mismatch repair protein MutS2